MLIQRLHRLSSFAGLALFLMGTGGVLFSTANTHAANAAGSGQPVAGSVAARGSSTGGQAAGSNGGDWQAAVAQERRVLHELLVRDASKNPSLAAWLMEQIGTDTVDNRSGALHLYAIGMYQKDDLTAQSVGGGRTALAGYLRQAVQAGNEAAVGLGGVPSGAIVIALHAGTSSGSSSKAWIWRPGGQEGSKDVRVARAVAGVAPPQVSADIAVSLMFVGRAAGQPASKNSEPPQATPVPADWLRAAVAIRRSRNDPAYQPSIGEVVDEVWRLDDQGRDDQGGSRQAGAGRTGAGGGTKGSKR